MNRTMHRLLPQFVQFSRKCSVMKEAKPLTAGKSPKCMDLDTTNIISTMGQSTTIESLHAETLPILETGAAVLPTTFEISTPKIEPQAPTERTPLPYEEIPGPAILKLWEKYWKYVPLLGTQLFCSLLINRFNQGRLSWNRNVTPIKYLFNEYGCIVRINGPLVGDIVMIHRPEHIAEVLKQEANTPIRSGIDVLQHYRLNYRKYRLAGPFSLQGSEWLMIRQKVDEEFRQIATTFFSKLDNVCDELIIRIRRIRNRQDEVPSNFHEDLTRWGMECFSTLIFNKHLGFLEPGGFIPSSEPTRIIDALMTAHKYMSRCETGFQVWRFFRTPFMRKLFSACDILDGVVGKYIRQTQNELRHKFSPSRGENGGEIGLPVLEKFLVNDGISPDDICTLLMDMIILGVQPTANCEAFLLYYLAKNPRAQKKLYHEITSVAPNDSITEKNIKNMPFLKACLQETLRLRPAFPYITRLLSKPISIHGYTIPKGTYVIMANQITSRREENFEDPDKFQPERWLSEDNSHSEFSCLPFGYGMRSCLGKNMAEMEMMLLTAKLVRQFRIEYDYADIQSSFMMVNVPNKPLKFRFVDRD